MSRICTTLTNTHWIPVVEFWMMCPCYLMVSRISRAPLARQVESAIQGINPYQLDSAVSWYLSAGYWFIRWIVLFNVEQPEPERYPHEENIKIILWLSMKDLKTPFTLPWARILSFKSTIHSYDSTVVQKWLTEQENYGLHLKRIFGLIERQIKAPCVWMYPWSFRGKQSTKIAAST